MTDKEFYQELMRRMNGPARQFERTFMDEFQKEHPTLQQSLVRHLIAPALSILAQPIGIDARNQASHDFAVKAFSGPEVPYFPTI